MKNATNNTTGMLTRSAARKAKLQPPKAATPLPHDVRALELRQEHAEDLSRGGGIANGGLTIHSNNSVQSFYSCIDGPLSSVESDGEETSGGGSFSSISSSSASEDMDWDAQQASRQAELFDDLFEGPLTPLPSAYVSSSENSNAGSSLFDNYHNIQDFAGLAASQASPRRPLQRSPVQHWRLGNHGSLAPLHEDGATPAPQPPPQRQTTPDTQDIFNREYRMLHQTKDTLMAALADSFEEEMREDAMVICSSPKKRKGKERAVDEQMNVLPQGPCLGPHGTEIIGPGWRPDSAEGSAYPPEWAARRSSGIQTYPTEPAI